MGNPVTSARKANNCAGGRYDWSLVEQVKAVSQYASGGFGDGNRTLVLSF